MCMDLRYYYWWPNMKRDVAWYVKRCVTCRKVKVDNQRPHDKLQPLDIPLWKCEEFIMDFITKLPKMNHGSYAIWIIMDHFTKCAYIIVIQEDSLTKKLADI